MPPSAVIASAAWLGRTALGGDENGDLRAAFRDGARQQLLVECSPSEAVCGRFASAAIGNAADSGNPG